MSSFHNNALVGASGQAGYQIERSLRFNSADSAYLNRTPASAGNRKTWTWAGWVKRSKLGVDAALFHAWDGSSSRRSQFYFNTSDQFVMNQGGGGTSAIGNTTAVFRDVSAWYHFVFYADYANTTFKLYVNNVEQTLSYSISVINADGQINAAIVHQIGSIGGSSAYFDGYLTEIHFIDGQALTPSSFGETDTITGVWKPKKYAGTYGTNGFYLKFADNSGTTSTTLGKDSSGNSNNWTPNNFSVTAGAGNDSMIDTPTPYADGGNGRGNYCTLNPLDGNQYNASAKFTCSNGNLTATGGSVTANGTGTIALPAGKWYVEFTVGSIATPSTNYMWFGCQDVLGFTGNGSGYNNSGAITCNGSVQGTFATFTAGDVIGCAYNITDNQVAFYKNGVQQGTTGTLGVTTKQYNVWMQTNSNGDYFDANFGQRAFAYTPPSGFLALNTQNLPEPSIKKPSQWFDATLYTGNGSTQSIVNAAGFQPDLVWGKSRSNAGYDHFWYDALRGTTKWLGSSSTSAEQTISGLTAFNSTGFTLGSDANSNGNASTYVGWQWKESATPGFDIVTYTGNGGTQNISHTLGVVPRMIIIKDRSAVTNWYVYHTSLGTSQALLLSSANAAFAPSPAGVSAVSSSNFTLGGARGETNTNAENYVAYLWSEVAGFSKFGSYTGNGSSDGPFVFCGFRPRWVLAKRSDASAYNWFIIDAARSPENVSDEWLLPNGSNAEQAQVVADMVSNGFKIRSSLSEFNINGGTYIFAAFAESPFKYSLAR